MKRSLLNFLTQWKNTPSRKPLILRGARQVGKTFIINEFGTNFFPKYVKIDFEKQKTLHTAFEGNLDPKTILLQIEALTGKQIHAGITLLFFDEIQACPRALMSLRYFYEEMPLLHVIAAGSLLEMMLGDATFPVGRVQFAYLYPMNFIEFLQAIGQESLCEYIPQLASVDPVPPAIHETLLNQFRIYCSTGGMPEAVARYVADQSFIGVVQVHRALFQSYREDFIRYNKRVDIESLDTIFTHIPEYIGKQVKYTGLDPDRRIEKVKTALYILERSLLIRKVIAVSSADVPLKSHEDRSKFKLLFLDMGLMLSVCGLDAGEVFSSPSILDTFKGALAEQCIGQQIIASQPPTVSTDMYYWARFQKSSLAEIDFLITFEGMPVPIEVKSSTAGRLKSLHLFLAENPSCKDGVVLSMRNVSYDAEHRIRFLPLYSRFDVR